MSSRIRIFDHFQKPLIELNGIPTTPRGWILNKYSRAEYSISTSDPKCKEKYFQFGNLVHIEHLPKRDWDLSVKGTLPSWTGIILPDRNWDNGALHVTVYSAEAILAFRAMPYLTVKNQPKEVFKTILNHAHDHARNIIIQPGQLDDLPITYPDDLRTNAYDHIIKMTGDCRMDWDVVGSVNEKGNLELVANLYNRKGIDTALSLNSSNVELQGPLLTEQGTPSNHVFGYSQSSTSESRIGPLEGIYQDSLNDYGSLQLNQVFIGKRDASSVLRSSQNKADNRGRPVKIIKRIALDNKKTFDYLNVGNTATVKESKVGFNKNGGFGFESKVKILTMDYNDLSNKVVLNVEVNDAT